MYCQLKDAQADGRWTGPVCEWTSRTDGQGERINGSGTIGHYWPTTSRDSHDPRKIRQYWQPLPHYYSLFVTLKQLLDHYRPQLDRGG